MTFIWDVLSSVMETNYGDTDMYVGVTVEDDTQIYEYNVVVCNIK